MGKKHTKKKNTNQYLSSQKVKLVENWKHKVQYFSGAEKFESEVRFSSFLLGVFLVFAQLNGSRNL